MFLTFYPQVYDTGRQSMKLNLTSPSTPHFVLRGLKRMSKYRLEVYATNRKGSSRRTIFKEVNMRSMLPESTESSDIGQYVKQLNFIFKQRCLTLKGSILL